MALVAAEANQIADAEKTRLLYVSLHTASPGTTGTNEATGGSPAYARKALSWGAASGGTATAAEVTFDVPAGTYTHFGVWDAATAGNFRGGNPLNANQVLAAQGQIKFTASLPVTLT